MMEIKLVQLQKHGDDRGALIALEDQRNVPFEIKRVYYLFDTKEGIKRGFHAHRNLRQIVIAVRGQCRFILDNGSERVELFLDNPAQGLLIESTMWREMYDFSPDCVLMVLASAHYDESDYIRDYKEFLENIKGESNAT
jgi:dTDP-4-dehydrorhamnose 3,5-epimerase-like enzyme